MQIIQSVYRWTQDEYDYITNHYQSMSDEEIGKELNRSASAVKSARGRLNLYRERKRPKQCCNGVDTRKYSFDEIQTLFKDRGYTLLSTQNEYKNKSSKLSYICNKHPDKGTQVISVHKFLIGQGCYYCGRERTNLAHKSKITPEQDKFLCEKKGFEYIRTDQIDGKAFIVFVCKRHRDLGIQKMTRGNMNRSENKGCQYCENKNLPHWYVKNHIESKYNIDVLSEYNGMNKMLTCRCRKHNCVYTTYAKTVFHHGGGCEQCAKEETGNRCRLSLKEVEKRILDRNPDVEILNLDEYTGYESQIKLRCKHCGSTWFSPFHSIIANSGMCLSCKIGSCGEQSISSFLLKNNIMFIPQYKFPDLIGRSKPLSFDFGIVDNNEKLLGLIEYNGEQHYHSVEYFGGETKFQDQVINDKKKVEYCGLHNIPYLIIPYWEHDSIEEKMYNFISGLE